MGWKHHLHPDTARHHSQPCYNSGLCGSLNPSATTTSSSVATTATEAITKGVVALLGPSSTVRRSAPWEGPRTLDKGLTTVYIDSVPNTGLWCVGCKYYWGGDGHSADNTTHTTTTPILPQSLAGLVKALAIVMYTSLGGMSVRK